MKKIKLALLTFALTALTSMTAFAASSNEGWVNKNGIWSYLDKDGDAVESVWKTNVDGTLYFYLDENGEMATSSLIEDGDYLYYVNADGVQERNHWELIEDEDDEKARWYYFDSKGRAVKSCKKVIDGKTYYFDEDGKMLYGWVSVGTDSNAAMVDNYLTGDIYLGDNMTGWRRENQWFKETNLEDISDLEYIWFYFKSNGHKETENRTRIDGVDYMFSANGEMIENRFVDYNGAKYFVSDNGSIYKNRWIWNVDEESEDGYWYYATKNGKLLVNTIEKINNKTYMFDENGRMITGFVGSITSSNADILDLSSKDFVDNNYSYYTENGNRIADDNIEVELEDGIFTFGFDKKGIALNGKVNNRLYINGILQKAIDEKYAFVNGYIVNTSGKVMSGKSYKIDDVTYVKNTNTGLYEKN
jgi:glucan-binding YG repeat protein